MTDVDKLFSEYRESHRSGGAADPSDFLARLEGTDRAELLALIDAYLARSPGRSWDATAFTGSGAERVTNQVASEWNDWELAPEVAGWQELLPALRNKASLKRREVVERLAEALGVGAQAERVAAYYHEMETGELAAEGVSNKVLDALGGVLGETRERLRAAGAAATKPGGPDVRVSFARKAIITEDLAIADMSMPAAGDMASPGDPDAERVDDLFTGGPGAGD